MSKTNLIKKLEMERNSRVITYATSDRAPLLPELQVTLFHYSATSSTLSVK